MPRRFLLAFTLTVDRAQAKLLPDQFGQAEFGDPAEPDVTTTWSAPARPRRQRSCQVGVKSAP
jgi:hypothetical protein